MTEPTPTPTPSGLLVIDKPEGITSMGVCRRVRGALVAGGAPKRIKVGHGGTLDPLATGVLVVLVGKATRLCDQIMAGPKRYIAEVDLSRTSTTDDREGEQHEVCCFRAPTIDEVRAACARFVGDILQSPPAFSAIKVDGKRAYRLAREGSPPSLPPRPVRIDSIDVLRYEWPIASLDITCGKGTYIRSLARDLGRSLTGGGMLRSLRRTRVGRFGIEDARRIDRGLGPMHAEDLLPVPADL
ncbi:MAG: tRNA pseudouridine(55) synthase TruB [Phycisphaerae bacterium]|nr:tRNA pseudouridine(55) synthase TruB [Phycisphaerae bacterium]